MKFEQIIISLLMIIYVFICFIILKRKPSVGKSFTFIFTSSAMLVIGVSLFLTIYSELSFLDFLTIAGGGVLMSLFFAITYILPMKLKEKYKKNDV